MVCYRKASVAIDGSKFKAVNNRDKNFTSAKVERRRKQLEESVSRYLSQLDTADLQDPSETLTLKKARIKEKLEKLKSEMDKLAAIERQVLAAPDHQISLTDPDSRSMATSGRGSGVVGYNVQVAVDTEHHMIVTHEVTNVGYGYAHNLPIRRKPQGCAGDGKPRSRRRPRLLQRRGDLGLRSGRHHRHVTETA